MTFLKRDEKRFILILFESSIGAVVLFIFLDGIGLKHIERYSMCFCYNLISVGKSNKIISLGLYPEVTRPSHN